MARWFPWFTLSAFAALMAVSPVLAANEQTPSARGAQVTLNTPAAVQQPALQPVTNTAADKSTLKLKPMLTTRAPFETVWNTTLLAASSQSMGLRASRARGTNDHIRWTITGAAVGAIVGLIADDPLRDAAIGAAVGFGASYVIQR